MQTNVYKIKKIFTSVLIVVLTAVLCLAQEDTKKTEELSTQEAPKELKAKSLIKTDLLTRKTEPLKPPKRNIFSPASQFIPEGRETPEEIQRKLEERALEFEKDVYDVLLDIRYIGYVVSGKKITALVVFEDEALTLEEGEMITQEIKVSKVSSQFIEISGPEEKITKFSLEGDGQ